MVINRHQKVTLRVSNWRSKGLQWFDKGCKTRLVDPNLPGTSERIGVVGGIIRRQKMRFNVKMCHSRGLQRLIGERESPSIYHGLSPGQFHVNHEGFLGVQRLAIKRAPYHLYHSQ
jgi:hypothetical protein